MYLGFSISSHLTLHITVFNYVKLPFIKESGLCSNWSEYYFATIHFQSELTLLSQKDCPLAEIEAVESELVLFRMM